MTSKDPKDGPAEGQNRTKKPRGMGGVILILALLMALFLVVSRSTLERDPSIDALYSHLFNGRVQSVDLSDTGTVRAQIQLKPGERPRDMEVFMPNLLRDHDDREMQMMRSLVNQRLDHTLFAGSDPLTEFAKAVESGSVRVTQAFFVTEHQPRSAEEHRARDGREPGSYLTAMLQEKDRSTYVKLEPTPGSKYSLQSVAVLLDQHHVPIRTQDLSLGNEFRIT